jgi:nicotinamidase/pyrazinamidase
MNVLIIVDMQNDFVQGGTLPVTGGKELTPVINGYQAMFDLVVATQDWHPANHGSFAVNHQGRNPGEVIDLNGLPQVLWPIHCVQQTAGADFIPGLDRDKWAAIFQKGTDPEVDSYSGFFDNGRRRATGLGDFLRMRSVAAVYIAGLATDYCVKFTALDARALGFSTVLIDDACRGVDLHPGDVEKAISQMTLAGVTVGRGPQLLRQR